VDSPLVPIADPFLGRSLAGRYRVDRKLGEGGMGAVYAGEHLLIQRPVAIKILHPQLATNADLVRRFLNEARAVTAIRHENIVDVTDMGQLEDGTLFMILELLEGRDFAAAIERGGPLPFVRVLHILDQMCAALEVAHERGIVHRDLKPENVFLIRRGDDPDFVKILDFGIAKILEGDSGVRTKTGLAMGTLHYMPPEQVQAGKDLDHRADIYALGVILFRALGGTFPYDGDTMAVLLSRILLDPVPPLRTVRPDAPVELEAVVTRCLAKRASDRFASCRELRAALRKVAQGLSQPSMAFADTAHASPVPPPSPAPSPATHAFAEIERPAPPTEQAPASPRQVPIAMLGLAGLGLVAIAGIGGYLGWSALATSEPEPVAAPRVDSPPTTEPAPIAPPPVVRAPVEPPPAPPMAEAPLPPPAAPVVEATPAPSEAAPAVPIEPAPTERPRVRRPIVAAPSIAQPVAPQPLAPQPLAPQPTSSPPSTGLGNLGQGTLRRIP
jgi:serine/threonine-protein kinase